MIVKTVVFLFYLVLQAATNVSEEHAAFIFRVEVCKFGNGVGYIDKLQGGWSWDPRSGGKERNPVQANGKKWIQEVLERTGCLLSFDITWTA
jgi:hypothetical protein